MGRHIYFHIPFCAAKCPYCSFYSVARSRPQFKDAALAELTMLESLIRRNPGLGLDTEGGDTIYFGGGTPSVPDSSLVCDLLTEARRIFDIGKDAEITIEANPFSLTADKAIAYRKAGFNRISIGAQSLDDNVLKTLGRLHDREGAINALDTARDAGFTNISADLIIGVPGQTLSGVIRDADTLIEHGAVHISMYSLTIEEGTPFYSLYRDTLEDLVPPESEREMYHGLRDHLASRGFVPYEISNCALPGHESRHNMMYWRGGEYFAVGAGAHGYLGGVRYAHPDDVDLYTGNRTDADGFERLLSGQTDDIGAIRALERLTLKDKMHEYAMLMLRTSGGIDPKEFETRFEKSVRELFAQAIESNVAKGLLVDTGDRICLTAKGLDFANQVFEDFI